MSSDNINDVIKTGRGYPMKRTLDDFEAYIEILPQPDGTYAVGLGRGLSFRGRAPFSIGKQKIFYCQLTRPAAERAREDVALQMIQTGGGSAFPRGGPRPNSEFEALADG